MDDFSQVVIIKSFNDESNIERCIESVISQENFSKLRVYIIDDASTDQTQKLITKYKKYFYKIELRKTNLGPSHNVKDYNKILENYHDGYIVILSGDDYMPLSKTIEHENIFLNHDIGLHFGIGYVKDLKNKIIKKFPKNQKKNEYLNQKHNLYFKLIDNNYIPSFACAYSIKYLKKIAGFKRYPDNNISIDLSTIFYLSDLSSFYFSNKVLGYWISSPKQQTSNYRDNQIKLDSIFLNYFVENQLKENKISFKQYKSLKNKIIKFYNYKDYYCLKNDLKFSKIFSSIFLTIKIILKKNTFVTKVKAIVLIILFFLGLKKLVLK